MILKTDNLLIRSFIESDGRAFAKMAEDGSLSDVGLTADCAEWIDEWAKEATALSREDDPKKEYIACTVCLRATNEVIGSVGCSYYEDLDEVGITYFIGNQYRQNGYAAESVRAYSDYFFSHYPIDRLIATIREANAASWKTIESCSFSLIEEKMYKDLNDETEQMYRFYERRRQ